MHMTLGRGGNQTDFQGLVWVQVQADAKLPGPPAAKKIRMSTSLQLPAGNKGLHRAAKISRQAAPRSAIQQLQHRAAILLR